VDEPRGTDSSRLPRGAQERVATQDFVCLPSAARRRLEALAETTDWGEPHAEEAFLQAALEEIMARLQSPVGFLHELGPGASGEDQVTVRAIWPASVLDQCQMLPDTMAGRLNEAGIWADAARHRQPIIHNDYEHAPGRTGLPQGHVPLTREIVVPVERSGRVEAVVGVGNRATPYTPRDAGVLQSLANTLWDLRDRALGDWNNRRLLRGEQTVNDALHAVLARSGETAGVLDALSALRETLDAAAVVIGRVAPGRRLTVELVHTAEGGRHLRPPIRLDGPGPHETAFLDGQASLVNDLGAAAEVYADLYAALSPTTDGPTHRALFVPVSLPNGEPDHAWGDTTEWSGALWGVLGALDGPRPWDAVDTQLASRVANVLALAAGSQRDEARRARADARFRAVFEHIVDGVAVVEPQDGRLVLVNPGFSRLVGLPRDTLLGLSVADFARRVPHPTRLDLVLSDLRRVLNGEVVLRRGLSLPRPDGAVRRVDITAVAIPWGAGQAVLSVLRDVTELEAARAQAAQQDRLASLGGLAAGVAHEINNPLTYILSTLDAVTRLAPRWGDHDLAQEARDSLRGAREIARLARGLLAFGRAQDEEPAPVDLRAPLEHAVTLAYNQLKHRARFVKRLHQAPPVWAVDGKIAQVALNLLVNAAHAIPEADDARDHEVRLELWSEEDVVCFAVEDTGVGISHSIRHRIFEPFFTTKARGVGSGLGLSLSRALVEEMGGEIAVESPTPRGREALAAGRGLPGSRFTVRLPTAPPERQRLARRILGPTPVPVEQDGVGEPNPEPREPEAHPGGPHPASTPTPSAAPAAPSSRAGRPRLLLVDDEPEVLSALSRWLTLDFEVTKAPSGEAALATVRERLAGQDPERAAPFDLILCDVMMPGMSGVDVHRALEDEAPTLARRFAVITGGIDRQDLEAYIVERDLPRLDKPFDPAKAIELLERFADRFDA